MNCCYHIGTADLSTVTKNIRLSMPGIKSKISVCPKQANFNVIRSKNSVNQYAEEGSVACFSGVSF